MSHSRQTKRDRQSYWRARSSLLIDPIKSDRALARKDKEVRAKTGLAAIRSLDYVILLCDDFGKMERYYRDVFKFEIEDEEPGIWIGFRVGTLFLALRPRGRKYDGPRVPETSATIQLSFRVPPADVDAAYHELRERGVNVIEGPTNQDWPHRTLFIRDPENNIIEIFADIHPRETAASSTGTHALIKE